MLDSSAEVPLLVAIVGVISALLISLLSRRHQREHQQRELMMKPSEEYARRTLEALAALRYLTPPPLHPLPRLPHRNECLLVDSEERSARIVRCEAAIDATRATRAHLRLVFHPDSAVSDSALLVLVGMRACLTAATEYYQRADLAGSSNSSWRQGEGKDLRMEYMRLRAAAYKDLDTFFHAATARLQAPLRPYTRFERFRAVPPIDM